MHQFVRASLVAGLICPSTSEKAYRRTGGVRVNFGRDLVCPSRLPRCVRAWLVVAEVVSDGDRGVPMVSEEPDLGSATRVVGRVWAAPWAWAPMDWA